MLFLHELYMHRDWPAHRMRSRSMIVNPLLTRAESPPGAADSGHDLGGCPIATIVGTGAVQCTFQVTLLHFAPN